MRIASILAVLLLAVSATVTRGDFINLSTGLNSLGNVITTGGVNDANWTVTKDSTYSPTGIPQTVFPNNADWFGRWVANDANSDWIARNAGATNNGPAPYTFTRTFDLTGYNLSTATLSGSWTIDDQGTLALNGHTVSTIPGVSVVGGAFFSFTAPNADFVQGVNSLTMTITTDDQFLEGARLAGSVSALAAAVPEPSALVLLGLGSLAFGGLQLERRLRNLNAPTFVPDLKRGFGLNRSLPLSVLLALTICGLAGESARADIVVYSNLANASGSASATAGSTTISGGAQTIMAADDITVGSQNYAGLSVDGFTFSVANTNATAVSARADVRIYAGDGDHGGLGTLLAAFDLNPITFAGNTTSNISYTPGTPLFTIPTASVLAWGSIGIVNFWAGVSFDNNGGTTGATADQLNNLGQILNGPPTIGSSRDVFFLSTDVGTFLTNNPAGGYWNFGVNGPPANLSWQFTAIVPEPSPYLLASCAGFAFFCVGLARKRFARRV